MKKGINETLAELLIGILTSGVLIQIVALIVSGFLPKFVIGLWIGVISALFLAVHMYRSIDRALDMPPDEAEKYMRKAYVIRTVVILAVAGIICYLKVGYVMAVFVGMLCLKFGAFLQPLTHKLVQKIKK